MTNEKLAKKILEPHRKVSPTCALVFTEKAIVEALSEKDKEIASLKEAMKTKYGVWLCPDCGMGTSSGHKCPACLDKEIERLEAHLKVCLNLLLEIAGHHDGTDVECEKCQAKSALQFNPSMLERMEAEKEVIELAKELVRDNSSINIDGFFLRLEPLIKKLEETKEKP